MKLVETHLSRVWIGEQLVYKLLKPVHYAFIDLSTVDDRQRELEAELEHNTPWAPDVYREVVRVSGTPPVPDPQGDEPALVMRKLPNERTLQALGPELTVADIERVGRTLRARHEAMPPRPGAADVAAVRHRILENLDELEALEPPRYAGVREAFEASLHTHHEALHQRREHARKLHGDLRAEHVYLLDEILVLDGVAFDPHLAEGDPVEDVAFLAMDLTASVGRWDLEAPLWRSWAGDDHIEPGICALYMAHRAAIRAKVALLQHDPAATLRAMNQIAVRLRPARQRPCLVGIGGLPGVGKSTVARGLAQARGLEVIRTDVVRQQVDQTERYTDEARTQVYQAVLDHARARFEAGADRLLIDASFGKHPWRRMLDDLALELGVPSGLLICDVPEAIAIERIRGRTDDASEADEHVHRKARQEWEPLRGARHQKIDGSGSPEAVVDQAIAALEHWGL